MVDVERRKHERISIQMPTRMWLDEVYRGKHILFEGYSITNDLAIGGTFLVSDYLLPVGFPLNLEMRIDDHEFLLTRAEIVHSIANEEGHQPGMGVMFTEVDAENRERLLRFFVSERISEFYGDKFLVEFPHLESVLSLQDVALVINLWEDKDGRLTSLRKPPTEEARQTHRQQESRAAQRKRRR
jgi:uncharacterized protein (DUF952 family)